MSKELLICSLCGSKNLAQFNSEVNIHFSGMANLDKPSILAFPTLVICLDCGLTKCSLSVIELQLLREGLQAFRGTMI
jgi:hypothetical protein